MRVSRRKRNGNMRSVTSFIDEALKTISCNLSEKGATVGVKLLLVNFQETVVDCEH